jgi:tripartite ATP-independent transporter DctP family solute receptor
MPKKMKFTQIAAFLFILFVAVLRSTAVNSHAAEKTAVRISMASAANLEGTCWEKITNKYIQKLAEWSEGGLILDFYHSGQLGGDVEILEGVQLGSISILRGATSPQIRLIPELALLDIPYLFSSLEVCNEVLAGEFKDFIQNYYNNAGLQLLNCKAHSFRELGSRKPIRSIADFRDLNIRTMENEYHMAFWKALGANPVPLAFGEVYIALQQGMLDAQENPESVLKRAHLSEVQKYIVMTHHVPFINTYVMNKTQYDALSEENRALLMRFINELNAEEAKSSTLENEQALETDRDTSGMKAIGMEVIEPDAAMAAALKKANESVIELLRQNLSPELVDRFLAIVKAAEEKYLSE